MIDAAARAGITTVVAAGNEGDDAAATSPGSAPRALTVAALAANLTRPAWSNYGPAVDVFAPGHGVLSTWPTGNLTRTLSGTSMAAPHVAGLVLYLKATTPGGLAAPEAVAARVKGLAAQGLVKGAGAGSSNLIAYNGNGA